MKKRLLIIFSVIGVMIIGVIGFFALRGEEKIVANKDFIYMGEYREELANRTNYVITSFEDYKKIFDTNKLKKNDFDNNNYVIISMDYNPCSDSNVTPTDYTIKGENINVTVKYEAKCGLCAPENIYYLLKVDKSITSVNVNIKYKSINNPHCDPNVSYKPLIYLYPIEETNVIVKLGYPKLLTTTYPIYENEWNVVAKPNGELIDKKGRTYYGLYWEGINNIHDDFEDGFIVSKEETSLFLEEKLSILGLNEREANEFIIYWLPKLEENEYNMIRFEDIDIINEQMPLEINPSPDTIIRVFMEYKPVSKNTIIKEQKLVTPERKGFTVVEWGGSLIK